MDNKIFDELMKDLSETLVTGDIIDPTVGADMRVTTPLYVLNCMYGGGVPFGIIEEISGPPGSAKSTFLYQCLGNYIKEYPNGFPVVFDAENSWNSNRMEILGVDTKKVLLFKSSTLETTFSNMFKVLNKIDEMKRKELEKKDISDRDTKLINPSIFMVYDSISVGGTDKQNAQAESGNSTFGAGSMMESPRIIKSNLSNVLPYTTKFPLYLGLINQVFTHIGRFTSSVESGGGLGLKHICHSHLVFYDKKENWDGNFISSTISMAKLEKSKIAPKFTSIPVYMDSAKSGRIDEVESFLRYCYDPNIGFIKVAAWWNMKDTLEYFFDKYDSMKSNERLLEIYRKSFRQADLLDTIKSDKGLIDLLQVRLIDFIDDKYPGQSTITDGYKNKLINNCNYFDSYRNNKVLEGIENSNGDNE